MDAISPSPASPKIRAHSGRVLYYNLIDRRSELRERYDFLIIFDVLEHVADTTTFLEAAVFHEVLGHLRRYDRRLLSQHLVDAGLDVLSVRYWALTMIPIIYLRALLVNAVADADKILKLGFKPPGRVMAAALSGLLSIETWAARSPAIGTCLLAVAQKTT
jgi:hypothetical protein